MEESGIQAHNMNLDEPKKEKNHSMLVPLLVVLLTLIILGVSVYAAYYYYTNKTASDQTSTPAPTATESKTQDETDLDDAAAGLEGTDDLNTKELDKDTEELNKIDLTGV